LNPFFYLYLRHRGQLSRAAPRSLIPRGIRGLQPPGGTYLAET
jgi:hypothetical protein